MKNRLAASAATLTCVVTTNVEPVKVRTARMKCYRSAIADGARVTDRVVAMRGDRSGSHTVGTI